MEAELQEYKGNHAYKTDAKNRVNVYPSWRTPADESINIMPSRREGEPFLKVFRDAGYRARLNIIEESFESAGERSSNVRKLRRKIREIKLSPQGKLQIPKLLADKAGIAPETEVVLSAGESHYEIWSKKAYDTVYADEDDFEEEDENQIF